MWRIVLLEWAFLIAVITTVSFSLYRHDDPTAERKKFIKWLLWDFSGARFVYEKIITRHPNQTEIKPAPTFLLWTIGIYIALFGIASQRYENRVDIIENRINGIYAQISKDIHIAFQRIDDVQNMQCPTKPEIHHPLSVIKSFLPLHGVRYKNGVEQLRQLVEDWARKTESMQARIDKDPGGNGWLSELKSAAKAIKGQTIGILAHVDLGGARLEGADLSRARLKRADLSGAHLQGAKLWKAHLQGADLTGAALEGADLSEARLEGADLFGARLKGADLRAAHLTRADLSRVDFQGADLRGVRLEGADLHKANFKNADLRGAYLDGAYLTEANLKETKYVTVEQLCATKTLYRSELNANHLKQIHETCPKLLGDME